MARCLVSRRDRHAAGMGAGAGTHDGQRFDRPRTPPRKPDWQLYWIVTRGVRYSGMGAWGGQVPDSTIWQVVTFLSRLDSLPPTIDSVWRKTGG